LVSTRLVIGQVPRLFTRFAFSQGTGAYDAPRCKRHVIWCLGNIGVTNPLWNNVN